MCIELGYNSNYNQEELDQFIAEQKRPHDQCQSIHFVNISAQKTANTFVFAVSLS